LYPSAIFIFHQEVQLFHEPSIVANCATKGHSDMHKRKLETGDFSRIYLNAISSRISP